MATILVTGASGFIGKKLVQLLLKEGHSVIAACRSNPQIDTSKHSNFYRWKSFDITSNNINYEQLLYRVDFVIHLAAVVHIMGNAGKNLQAEYFEINKNGTERLLLGSVKAGVQRFIYLSTIKVNGEQCLISSEGTLNSFTENDPVDPMDAYALSKYQAELSIINIAKESGIEFVILRPPLVYGPGVGANFLKLLTIIKKKYPLPFASINNKRSLIYVDNLTALLLLCMNHKNAKNKIYLVKDIDMSTPELIKIVAKYLGIEVRLFHLSSMILKCLGYITGKLSVINRLTDSLVIDDSKIRRELEWVPPNGVENAMKETTSWYIDQQIINKG